MPRPGFAVIDFETTGLSPATHDRVIEVAVVHVDEHGELSLVELVETRISFALNAGDLIVLTGEMTRPRSDWDIHLLSLGFTPWNAVTKKVKLVVAADPDSLSGKARKARDYGIPIVDEEGLERLLQL